jgi:hypothetical protein
MTSYPRIIGTMAEQQEMVGVLRLRSKAGTLWVLLWLGIPCRRHIWTDLLQKSCVFVSAPTHRLTAILCFMELVAAYGSQWAALVLLLIHSSMKAE